MGRWVDGCLDLSGAHFQPDGCLSIKKYNKFTNVSILLVRNTLLFLVALIFFKILYIVFGIPINIPIQYNYLAKHNSRLKYSQIISLLQDSVLHSVGTLMLCLFT